MLKYEMDWIETIAWVLLATIAFQVIVYGFPTTDNGVLCFSALIVMLAGASMRLKTLRGRYESSSSDSNSGADNRRG